MNSNFRNLALWVVIGLLLIALFNLFQSPAQRSNATEISYSQLLNDVNNGQVRAVTIAGNDIVGMGELMRIDGAIGVRITSVES